MRRLAAGEDSRPGGEHHSVSLAVLALGTAPTVALIVLVLLLVLVAVYLLLQRRRLRRRVNNLIEGLWKMAAKDLSFRFPAESRDEIGLVERSLNRIADRIQGQQMELRETMEYLEGIVENTADLIITVNPEGTIETFNRGAEKALGYQREELLGKRIERLFADRRERDLAIERLKKQDDVINYETRFLTKEGESRTVLLTISYLRDREGHILGRLGISKDITREKELQHKLMKSEQIAAIGQSMTGIVHTIKNMLNTLRGGLYVAQIGHKKQKEDLFSEGCTMLEEGLARISDLSQHMLKYAREWTVEPEPTDLAQIIDQVESSVRKRADDVGIELRSEKSDEVPIVSCDPRLIHLVLMDLVTNALDACEEMDNSEGIQREVVLRLALGDEGNRIRIEVQDNGPGMAPETVEHVFQPFVSTKKMGTGLGLSLATRIAELHGGSIGVDTAPNEGATFRVELPLNDQGYNKGVQDD